MPNTSAKDDIADLMKRLTDPVTKPTDHEAGPLVRMLVATDWTSAAVPLTVLKAFRVIVPASAPLQLAFAVPHEPTAEDAQCVAVLAQGADAGGDLFGLEVLSFEQALAAPYDAAVVPTGSSDELITQVGGIIVRMHDVVRRLEASAGVFTVGDPTLNVGDSVALRLRLASFAA